MELEQALKIVKSHARDYEYLDDEWKNNDKVVDVAFNANKEVYFLLLPQYQTLVRARVLIEYDSMYYFLLPSEFKNDQQIIDILIAKKAINSELMVSNNMLSESVENVKKYLLPRRSILMLLFKNHPIMKCVKSLKELVKSNEYFYDLVPEEIRSELLPTYIEKREHSKTPEFIIKKYQPVAKNYYEALYLGAPQLATIEAKTQAGKIIKLHSIILSENVFNMCDLVFKDDTKIEDMLKYIYTNRVDTTKSIEYLLELYHALVSGNFINSDHRHIEDMYRHICAEIKAGTSLTVDQFLKFKYLFAPKEDIFRCISSLNKDELLKLLPHFDKFTEDEKNYILKYAIQKN